MPATVLTFGESPISRTSSEDCLTNWPQHWRIKGRVAKLPDPWWRRPGKWLLLALLIVATLALATGCCSPNPTNSVNRPLLPAGRPPDYSVQLREAQTAWVYSGTGSDMDPFWVRVPASDLDLLLEDLVNHKAWSRALETAGRWRRE